jgi:PDZ domain-containing protein
MPRRRVIGWTSLVAALVLALGLSFIPSPYVIEQPGPVYNTLGTTTHDDRDVPLISITGEQTYPTSGSLDMLTVSVVGSPQNLPSWAEVVEAWFDRSRAVVPVESIYPSSETVEERDQQNQRLMIDSQQEAIAAALTNLGYRYTESVSVEQVGEGTPATGILQTGDIIESVNGRAVTTLDELRTAISENGDATSATLIVSRNDAQQTVKVTPRKNNSGSVVLGIGVAVVYHFPFTVEIQLDNVGGPSAGMMFALGIIDTLTPDNLTGGQMVRSVQSGVFVRKCMGHSEKEPPGFLPQQPIVTKSSGIFQTVSPSLPSRPSTILLLPCV